MPLLVQAGDEVVDFATDDPAMSAAITEARGTLPQFLKKFEAGAIPAQMSYLKVAMPTTGAEVSDEVIWVGDFSKAGADLYTGKLANEPNHLPGLHAGSDVQFGEAQIYDWGVVLNGRGYGYYTLHVMLPRLDAGQATELRGFLAPAPVPPGW